MSPNDQKIINQYKSIWCCMIIICVSWGIFSHYWYDESVRLPQGVLLEDHVIQLSWLFEEITVYRSPGLSDTRMKVWNGEFHKYLRDWPLNPVSVLGQQSVTSWVHAWYMLHNKSSELVNTSSAVTPYPTQNVPGGLLCQLPKHKTLFVLSNGTFEILLRNMTSGI